MNTTALTYQLPSFVGVISHGWSQPAFVRDMLEDQPVDNLDVQVKSGDYFVTLATELDRLSRDIESYSVRNKLENIVSDLIHLQDDYTITKK